MIDSMTNSEKLVFMIGFIIFSILILASLITFLLGFSYSIINKETIGKKLIWFGAFCAMIAFSLWLLADAWIDRSWFSLVAVIGIWTFIGLRKKCCCFRKPQ